MALGATNAKIAGICAISSGEEEPMEIRWCKRCVETSTRPTTQFDSEGVCQACRNTSDKAAEVIDWDERNRKLSEIVAWAKSRNVSGYDCIIGVSGGKDSTRQALFAREIGLKPLLVSCVYPPEQITDRGVDNLANLISLGFDTITVAPAPGISKAMSLHCFKTFGNLVNASELALFGSLPIAALAYNIPLILLGENPGLAWGNNVGSLDFDGNKMRNLYTLRGGDPHQFSPGNIPDEMFYWYFYPSEAEMDRANTKIVFLGYFMPDFNDHTNAKVGLEHGLKIREGRDAVPENMGGIYPYVALDMDLVIANQMLKYLKYGFGKATQEIGSAIRFGRMSRQEGVEAVKRFDGQCADFYLEQFCSYLEISRDEFWEIAEKFINKDLFKEVSRHKWVPKYEIK